MSRLGDREIAATESFILPNGESGFFQAKVAGQNLKFTIKVVLGNPGDASTTSVHASEDGVIHIVLSNWRSPVATGLVAPSRIGHAGTTPFGFNIIHMASPPIDFVTVQIYEGGKY